VEGNRYQDSARCRATTGSGRRLRSAAPVRPGGSSRLGERRRPTAFRQLGLRLGAQRDRPDLCCHELQSPRPADRARRDTDEFSGPARGPRPGSGRILPRHCRVRRSRSQLAYRYRPDRGVGSTAGSREVRVGTCARKRRCCPTSLARLTIRPPRRRPARQPADCLRRADPMLIMHSCGRLPVQTAAAPNHLPGRPVPRGPSQRAVSWPRTGRCPGGRAAWARRSSSSGSPSRPARWATRAPANPDRPGRTVEGFASHDDREYRGERHG
jgi:hypothetical protein